MNIDTTHDENMRDYTIHYGLTKSQQLTRK